jgi:hypothetical protein
VCQRRFMPIGIGNGKGKRERPISHREKPSQRSRDSHLNCSAPPQITTKTAATGPSSRSQFRVPRPRLRRTAPALRYPLNREKGEKGTEPFFLAKRGRSHFSWLALCACQSNSCYATLARRAFLEASVLGDGLGHAVSEAGPAAAPEPKQTTRCSRLSQTNSTRTFAK